MNKVKYQDLWSVNTIMNKVNTDFFIESLGTRRQTEFARGTFR